MAKHDKFSEKHLVRLRAEYAPIQTVPTESLKKFHELFDNCSDNALKQLAQAKIKFVSLLAINACHRRNIKL